VGFLLLAGCTGRGREDLTGSWRAVLESPGGELPFELRIAPPGSTAPAIARNGPEEVPFTTVDRAGDEVRLRIDGYDSEIVARLDRDGEAMAGHWRRTSLEGVSELPFHATRGFPYRFPPPPAAPEKRPGTSVAGSWAVTFVDHTGRDPARAEFRQEGAQVTGTFLTSAGDYRYLEGDFRGDRLRLSCFDGGHVFLFDARLDRDGRLAGDFWSRDVYHAAWTARRLEGPDAPDGRPDPGALVQVRNDEGRLSFTFPDLDGVPVSLADERFRGHVVVVNLFGSWCPNCNDEAPVLVDWYRRFRDRGLEVVGLAFELTGKPARDGAFVRKFAQRHGVEYPLLLAGIADKDRAAASLPDLTGVAAFPTTIFVGRDGRVRHIHTGFEGPGTGAHHRQLVREMEARIEDLLSEAAPPPATR
jgi:peroxiredoxin